MNKLSSNFTKTRGVNQLASIYIYIYTNKNLE